MRCIVSSLNDNDEGMPFQIFDLMFKYQRDAAQYFHNIVLI